MLRASVPVKTNIKLVYLTHDLTKSAPGPLSFSFQLCTQRLSAKKVFIRTHRTLRCTHFNESCFGCTLCVRTLKLTISGHRGCCGFKFRFERRNLFPYFSFSLSHLSHNQKLTIRILQSEIIQRNFTSFK